MIINHNISALNTLNKLQKNNKLNRNVMEKLSSGLKINQASDDSAGLAISEKMRAQIRGLEQAQRNIQDGISLIQTAESGLASIQTPPLQRLRELAIQASNDTLTNSDRQRIQEEVEQIKKGINEVANNTEFNTRKLLNGNNVNFIEGVIEKKLLLNTSSDERIMVFSFFKEPIESDGLGISGDNPQGGGGYLRFSFSPTSVYDKVPLGSDMNESLDNLISEFNNIKSGITGTLNKRKLINDYNIRMERYGNHILFISKPNVKYTVGSVPSYTTHLIEPNQDYEISWKEEGLIKDNTINLQVGADSGQNFNIELTDATTTALGIDSIDFSTKQGAVSAISKIDKALETVSSERAKFGAYQNRLEHIHSNASNYEANLISANSRIRDADLAKLVMNLTKSQILSQASQAMLTHSFSQPQQILNLLR